MRAAEIIQHSCLDHLMFRECDSVDPHGERFHDEWWECAVCGKKITEDELAYMSEEQ